MNDNPLLYDRLPQEGLARVRRFMRDIAWGRLNRKWDGVLPYRNNPMGKVLELDSDNGLDLYEGDLSSYVLNVWENDTPDFSLLLDLGYLTIERHSANNLYSAYRLTEKAILLVEQPTTAAIFISYSRAESSALALLIVARFKEHGLSPFLDMHPNRDGLELGGQWHLDLEEQIYSRNNFILLVGPRTLNSLYVLKEIRWAIEAENRIIPIWHNGFTVEDLPQNLPREILDLIRSTHAAVVEDENPKQYNAVLDELLSNFGIAP